MTRQIINQYKIPFLLSITQSIILIAIKSYETPMVFTQIIIGSLLGTFLLDLDYIIYAFFTDPNESFSQNLRGYVKHKDLIGTLNYINYHADEIKEKILNSALFQIVLGASIIFVFASNANLFTKALIGSLFLNSIYRHIEAYYKNQLDQWFWAIKTKPTKSTFIMYTLTMVAVFVFAVSFIR